MVRWKKSAGRPKRNLDSIFPAKAEDAKLIHEKKYYSAVNIGLVIRRHYVLALKNLKPLAKKLESAQQKVPAEDSGGPGRVLGMLYLKAPPWPQNIGDCDKALALLKQTVEQFPQHPLNHLFYAQALWDINESDSIEAIRKELEKTRGLLKEEQWGFAKRVGSKNWRPLKKNCPLNNTHPSLMLYYLPVNQNLYETGPNQAKRLPQYSKSITFSPQ